VVAPAKEKRKPDPRTTLQHEANCKRALNNQANFCAAEQITGCIACSDMGFLTDVTGGEN